MSACEQIVDFIASGPSTSAVANFQASPELKERATELLSFDENQRRVAQAEGLAVSV